MRLTRRGRAVMLALAVVGACVLALAVLSVPLPDAAGYDVPPVCLDTGARC